MEDIKNKITAVTEEDTDVYNKPTKAVPKPAANIGIDTTNQMFDNIVSAGTTSKLDINAIESFSRVSQRRDQVYSLLDSMCEDSTVAAVLETYTEDATERNEEGKIVWAESSDPNVGKFVNFLLDSCRVDKHIYSWTNCLCKYGDVYLRLYRQSDYDAVDDLFNEDKEHLEEKVKIQAYDKNDHYVHYLELEPNPAEIFELTKFGKTHGYIKAEVSASTTIKQTPEALQPIYKFKKGDVTIYGATEYVHGALEDSTGRIPEQVNIFLDNQTENDAAKYSYKVRRGQSLFYNTFKIWRELTLLENSLLLNRITKSAVTRMINVEVGDMPKEMVGPHLQGIKQMLEQKIAYDSNNSVSEYTNPGPIENNVYLPTHGGVGALTATTVGGDVNVGQLTDIDHFRDKYFGNLRVPKQYFGYTDDNAGFSGGESLSIISSRYAKMIKRIQSTMIECITDAINLMLLDKGLKTYVGKFELHMLPPTTSEEMSRKEYISNSVQLVSDIMAMLTDVSDNTIKLKILKSLLSSIVTDTEVIELLQQQIDQIESELEQPKKQPVSSEENINSAQEFESNEPLDLDNSLGNNLGLEPTESEMKIPNEVNNETGSETILPTPSDLNIGDLSDSNNENL